MALLFRSANSLWFSGFECNRIGGGRKTLKCGLLTYFKIQEAEGMSIVTNARKDRELCERYSDTVWNKKEFDIVDALFHEDATIHSPLKELRGPKAMKNIIEVWLSAFPDLEITHEDIITEHGVVVVRWKARGTHRGEFKGISGSGAPISYEGVSIYRLEEERIVEYWAFVNLQTILDQIHSVVEV